VENALFEPILQCVFRYTATCLVASGVAYRVKKEMFKRAASAGCPSSLGRGSEGRLQAGTRARGD